MSAIDIFSPLSAISSFLNEKEKKELAIIEAKILRWEGTKKQFLRETAYKKGIVAKNLEDLKSKSGKPFIKIGGTTNPCIAETHESPKNIQKRETAYLCRGRPINDSENDGCGWVKGSPMEEEWSKTGILNGGQGKNLYCCICGKQLGSRTSMYY